MATQVGEAVVKLTFDGKDVKASLSKTSSEMEQSGKKSGIAWGTAYSVAVGSLISKAISKISGMISSNLDSAIKRVDIINNFPKMMSNMGISAEDSQKSIDKLSTKLMGLPTSLQAGVSAVERFTSKNGDVKKSTDLFLALNNAVLAGGAPMEQQSTAMEQLAQAYAKGKPDMIEWRSAMTAMPAQLNQVAEAMGFGKNGADKLGEALRKGEVSMDDFMGTITKMNTEGVNGFKTFEEQARNSTGGIGTALENVRNRVAQAIGKVIQAIGSSKIADAINNISSHFGDIADKVVDIVKFLSANKWILEFAGAFVGTLVAIGTALKVISAVLAVSPITWIIAGISAIVAGIVLLITHFDQISAWIHTNLPWLGSILDSIGAFFGVIGQHISTLVGMIANLWNSIIYPIIQAIVNFLGPVLGGLFSVAVASLNTIIGIFTGVFNTIFSVIETAVGIFTGFWQSVGSGAQQAWNTITGIFSKLAGFFGSIFSNAWQKVKAVFSTGGKIFMGIVDGIAKAFKAIVNAIITGINKVVALPFNSINGFLDGLRGIDILGVKPFGWVGRIDVPQIPTLAQGGYADGATNAIIGEAGKEVVLPLEQNTDNWAGLLAGELAQQFEKMDSTSGREIIVNMTNTINSDMDAEDIGRKLMESIRRSA